MQRPWSVAQLESRIFELEHIRICIRAPADTLVGWYIYERMAKDDMTLAVWLHTRIRGLVDGAEVLVFRPGVLTPNPRTKLGTIRRSYQK